MTVTETSNPFAQFAYGYNGVGNITSVAELGHGRQGQVLHCRIHVSARQGQVLNRHSQATLFSMLAQPGSWFRRLWSTPLVPVIGSCTPTAYFFCTSV